MIGNFLDNMAHWLVMNIDRIAMVTILILVVGIVVCVIGAIVQ